MARTRIQRTGRGGGLYFAAPQPDVDFIGSGCALLNLALTGGYEGAWPLGRISNVVGDRSTGKTLLAIEACANFHLRYPKGDIWYRETEAAFDPPYASALGMPVDAIDFGRSGEFATVEDVFADLEHILAKKTSSGLYVLDSLDALSDRAEQERAMGDATYGTGKAKAMSELFRRVAKKVETSNIHLMIISQIRDKIGVTFGDKWTRSGGNALDFYASQILYLAHMNQLVRTVRGVKRATGVRIRAKVKKNKIGLPFREAEFKIKFAFGIDDLAASVDWLAEVKRLDAIGLKVKGGDEEDDRESRKDKKEKKKSKASVVVDNYLDDVDEMSDEDYKAEIQRVSEITAEVWREIEEDFLPTRRKY